MGFSKFRIALFASGNGTNAERISSYFKHHTRIEVAMILSNNPQAFVLERAKRAGIPSRVFTRTQFRDSNEVLDWLNEFKVTHLVLAGFLWLIPENLLHAFKGKIINIHPALLPKFGGKGMYGNKVHEAVKLSGERETGITIHEVNEQYDEGKILFQARIPVEPENSTDTIAEKVHLLEYEHYPVIIERWILGQS